MVLKREFVRAFFTGLNRMLQGFLGLISLLAYHKGWSLGLGLRVYGFRPEGCSI